MGVAARTIRKQELPGQKAERGTTKAGSPIDVAAELRARIARHDLLPGTKLVEQELAQEFGTTRPRIREAFAALEQHGLVERIPNRGAIVTRISFEQILQIYCAREALEGMSVRLAAQLAPPGEWDDLIELFGAPMETALDNGDFDFYLEGYDRFRQRVVKNAGNPIIQGMLDSIMERTQAVIRRAIVLPGRAKLGLAHHRAVLAALRERDAEKAEAIRRQSLREAAEYLSKYRKFIV
ncbi:MULTISPECIES: GntR family transcriptional regulator [Cupriavidus]|uniref:DNA-binding GntR family transcriptional regulator n=2 Tax=Cupriavidus TaxID=106589 RepID=A0A7W4YU71_9BURK|nr:MULTISPECIES: GntR family transcriptional regulator [Cupriavidus]MBB3009916.1 DNA-binding GntR family transcriptional regulator [Cupriavidus alkaliphilus]QBY56210.1 GntR family transcriptional regulator [Cupriavidus oxalaticus]